MDRSVAPPRQKVTLSVAEASELSGFSERVIRTAIRRGELASLMPHGAVRGRRVRRRDLERWMREMGS
ncbi:helix-turn-helix domain-containing protein [Olsenella uli]|uniref:helix-turn-helix domain-containing protein n=1 Tax=Olsenella uli TaxID=133926 RepID=UPI0024A9C5D8|nr:helix-turn-helix domain-containing protein [Olsenella uli]